MTRACLCFLFLLGVTWGQEPTATPSVAGLSFLSVPEAANTIGGEPRDAFFARLHPREAATMTGVAIAQQTLEESRAFARDFFRGAVLEFTEEERGALTLHVQSLREQFADKYPLVVRRPWKFLKTRQDLCGGFSFTRGDAIVLSESTLAGLVKAAATEPHDTQRGEQLLLHEQLHVLQRAAPQLFRPLYEEVFHFRRAEVNIHPWIEERQVTNPDGIEDGWVAVTQDTADASVTHWIGTLLLTDKPVPQMGRDFSGVAVEVVPAKDGYEMVLGEQGHPQVKPLNALAAFTARLPIRPGYDHPNEVAAYLFTTITHEPPRRDLNGEAADVMARAKEWFAEHLQGEIPAAEQP